MFFLSNKVGPIEEQQPSHVPIQPILFEPEKAICRICLEEDIKLIRPCKCSGSIEHVHQSCMIRWIIRLLDLGQQVRCEICLEPIRFSTCSQLIWNPYKITENVNRLNPCFLTIFFACLIIISILSVILKLSSNEFLNQQGKIVLIVGLSVLSACELAILMMVLKTLFTERVVNIAAVLDREQESVEESRQNFASVSVSSSQYQSSAPDSASN